MSQEQILPGLRLKIGEINPLVITCGDPDRAEKIASLLQNTRVLQKNREYWTFEGEYQGKKITVVSHGVGASGAMLAFIGLMKGGAEVIVRVGTCGGLNKDVKAGSLVVATAAAKEDGVTDIYVPKSFPAIADITLSQALIQEAKQANCTIFDGIIVTQGAFYSGIVPTNTEQQAEAGAIALEMEVSALYIAASIYKKKAAAILSVDGSALAVLESAEDNDPDPKLLEDTVNSSIEVALNTLVKFDIGEE